MSWLNDVIWPAEARMRPEDAYAGMLLGCVEMLRHGITTSAEMYLHGEAVVNAALTAGSVGKAPSPRSMSGSTRTA
jgi:5-methylthioadenosine/S-adenosylhomocysteine deaminase